MIRTVSPFEVLASTRISLGLPAQQSPMEGLDDEFIAATLRRIAGFQCPCSSSTLKTVFFDAIEGLLEVDEALNKQIDRVLEDLQLGGDLLELSRVTTADERARSTWLFCAPPSFVLREGDVAHIFGISEEESLPLPDSLSRRVMHRGARRLLRASPGEDLRSALTTAGLSERSIESWLRIPNSVPPSQFLRLVDDSLQLAARCTPDLEIKVLVTANGGSRIWQSVGTSTSSGNYVCRRPQSYGADLWGYVEIDAGVPRRLIDLPLRNSESRGCDDGWRIQLARDHVHGIAQQFAVREVEPDYRIDIFTPLPMWARRRLEHTGQLVQPTSGMFSYTFEQSTLNSEVEFLEHAVWLVRSE